MHGRRFNFLLLKTGGAVAEVKILAAAFSRPDSSAEKSESWERVAVKSSLKIAFTGLLAALSVALMFLTGLVPVATLAIPALAGCLLIPVVVELNVRWGFACYGVCAVLSFLLAPDREAFLIYALFFGYYPVLYAVLGRMKSIPLRYVLKFIIFNVAVICEGLLSIYVLGIPFEALGILGNFTIPVLLLLGNVVFFLYDRALNGLVIEYVRRLHPRVRRLFH